MFFQLGRTMVTPGAVAALQQAEQEYDEFLDWIITEADRSSTCIMLPEEY